MGAYHPVLHLFYPQNPKFPTFSSLKHQFSPIKILIFPENDPKILIFPIPPATIKGRICTHGSSCHFSVVARNQLTLEGKVFELHHLYAIKMDTHSEQPIL